MTTTMSPMTTTPTPTTTANVTGSNGEGLLRMDRSTTAPSPLMTQRARPPSTSVAFVVAISPGSVMDTATLTSVGSTARPCAVPVDSASMRPSCANVSSTPCGATVPRNTHPPSGPLWTSSVSNMRTMGMLGSRPVIAA